MDIRTYVRLSILILRRKKATIKVLDNNSNIEIDSLDEWEMLKGVPFKKDFLERLKFIKDDTYVVFGLPDNGAYVKHVSEDNDIIVRKEKGEWVLVTRMDQAFYGCRFEYIPYLHVFQNLIFDYWYVNIFSNLELVISTISQSSFTRFEK